MISATSFVGTGVAIVTPFRNGEIDLVAFRGIIDFVLAGGVEYIVCLGSTGESALLTSDERRKVLDTAIEHIDRRVPLVAGNFGGNNTNQLVNEIEHFNFEGIDAILSSSPAYVKPTQEGIYLHYRAMASACPVPIILYNVPGRTSSNVLPETVLRLARDCPSIIGVKEASADNEQIARIIADRPEGFLVLSGDDPTALETIRIGGNGVISVIANALPAIFSGMVRMALAGNFDFASELDARLQEIHPLLYVEGNPAGIKGALEHLDLCTREVRLPLTSLTAETFDKLVKELNADG